MKLRGFACFLLQTGGARLSRVIFSLLSLTIV